MHQCQLCSAEGTVPVSVNNGDDVFIVYYCKTHYDELKNYTFIPNESNNDNE